MSDLEDRRRLLMAWTAEEMNSVQRVELGPRVLAFFEGTSGWAGEMADSDALIDAVFDRMRRLKPGRDGAVRMDLSTRQAEALLYYADVMAEATHPDSTGRPDDGEHAAAKRLLAQIAKKWPEARL